MRYQVDIFEVWARTVTVEADSVEAAKDKANDIIEAGNAVDTFEYSHTLDLDSWDAQKVEDTAPLTPENG